MRRVCGCTPASSAATEMTYSARSSRSIVAPPLLCICFSKQTRARIVGECLRQAFDRLALVMIQVDRDLHVDGDEQVAGLVAFAVDALAADTQHLAGRRPGRDAHRHLTVERRNLDVGAERGFR